MKGMLNFLEKAGLVKRDEPTEPLPAESAAALPESDPVPVALAELASRSPAVVEGVPMKLDEIYAQAGVPASVYPAERLLRLFDGLSAMDEATRMLAIKAMDAADESWSIDDPLADAAIKVEALNRHADRLQADFVALERETLARLQAVAARQEQVVGDIRKQIAELEALVARELARSAQETAAQDARLQTERQQLAGQLATISQTSQQLQSLARPFGQPAADQKE